MKFGIGHSYDRVLISKKLRAYLDLTKPASSVGVMLAIPFTAILFGELYHSSGVSYVASNWDSVLYASVTMFLLHGGSQAMNMAEDAHIDKQTDHKGNRPIPAGVISEEEARSIAWILIMAAVGRAFITSTYFGVFTIVLAFFGVFYNLEPIRSKKYLWVNLSWQAASRGLLLYPAAFAAFGDPLNPIAWAMGVVGFFLVLSMQNTADFSDVEMDKAFDITTPAVHYGLESLTYIMLGIVLIMFSILTMFIHFNVIPNFWSIYILAIPIMWSLWSLYNEPGDIPDLAENHMSWYVFYFCLAGLYIFPAIQLSLF